MEKITIANHKDFRKFDYISQKSDVVSLGDLIFKATPVGYPNQEPEIGVIIQVHENNEFRTDMFGNDSLDQSDYSKSYGACSFATLEQVKKYRPKLLKDIK